MLLLFNHTLTARQKDDARESLGVDTFVSPPDDIQELWGRIPPGEQALAALLAPVLAWVDHEARPEDCVLIQGDFGACYLAVRHCLERGLVPVYSTTRREASEVTAEGGEVRTIHVFRHVRFRRYGE